MRLVTRSSCLPLSLLDPCPSLLDFTSSLKNTYLPAPFFKKSLYLFGLFKSMRAQLNLVVLFLGALAWSFERGFFLGSGARLSVSLRTNLSGSSFLSSVVCVI